jgi:hypothetical protein
LIGLQEVSLALVLMGCAVVPTVVAEPLVTSMDDISRLSAEIGEVERESAWAPDCTRCSGRATDADSERWDAACALCTAPPHQKRAQRPQRLSVRFTDKGSEIIDEAAGHGAAAASAERVARVAGAVGAPRIQLLAEAALSAIEATSGFSALAIGGAVAAPALALGSGLLTGASALMALADYDEDDDAGVETRLAFETLRSDLWRVRDELVRHTDERAQEILAGIDEVLQGLDAAAERAEEHAKERRSEHSTILRSILDGTAELLNRDLALLEARYDGTYRWLKADTDPNRFRQDLAEAYALLSVDPLSTSLDSESDINGWRSLAARALATLPELNVSVPAWRGVSARQVAHPLLFARCARLFLRMVRGAFWLVDRTELDRRVAALRDKYATTMRYLIAAAQPGTLAAVAVSEWRRVNATWRPFLERLSNRLASAKADIDVVFHKDKTGIGWDTPVLADSVDGRPSRLT